MRRVLGNRMWRAGALALAATACVPLTGLGAAHTLTTATYRIGPFDLAAMGEPGWESAASRSSVPRPAGNVAIHDVDFDVVMEDGTSVPTHDVHLHHVLLFKHNATDPVCPGWPQTFAGAGAERTPIRLWSDYAYLLSAANTVDANWHIQNMMDEPMTVYIEYTIGYDADTGNHRGVTPYFLDVTGCGGGFTWDVPGDGGPGSVQTSTSDWVAPANGVAVYGGTHLHDGGIDGTLKEASSGLVGCTGTAEYDGEGMLMSINPCLMHFTVAAGQTYTQTIRYDNSEFRDDVMGIQLVYVWPGTPPGV